MTVTDAYTKWPEASALRTKSAKDVSAFLYSLLCRHGCPAEIVSDQGREFVNATVQQLNAYTATQHKVTAAYHPQTNGLSERMNQTLINALEKLNNAESNGEGPRFVRLRQYFVDCQHWACKCMGHSLHLLLSINVASSSVPRSQ